MGRYNQANFNSSVQWTIPHGRGQFLIWLAATGDTDVASREALPAAVRKALATHPGVTMAGLETITVDRPETFDDGLPAAEFFRLLRQAGEIDTALSPAGAPVLHARDVVQVAITPQWEPIGPGQTLFDQESRLVTPANAAAFGN